MFFKMKNYFLNLCVFLMLMSVILGVHSTTWLMMWMGMEMTLMFFTPKLILNKSIMESFSCLKYFIFQCLGSIFFILGMMDFLNFFFYFGLIIKMGMFPMHFWIISLSKSLSWLNFFFLMTIQKILPVLFFTMNFKYIMYSVMMLIIFNSIVSNLSSMNQMDLRLLMVFSSMNHMSWMILSSIFNMLFFYFYMSVYIFLIYYFCFFFSKKNIYFLFQMFYLKYYNKNYNLFMLILLFFSFLGFPPFLGFFIKLISIFSMLNFFYFLVLIMLLMQNMLISFSYLRVMMFFFLKSSRSVFFSTYNKTTFSLLIFILFLFLI